MAAGSLAARGVLGGSAAVEYEGFRKRVSQIAARQKENYKAALRFASRSISPGMSRLQYVKQAFAASEVLPDYLKNTLPYIPFVESGFRTSARSSVGAVGMWQFMRSTARRYRLVGRNFDYRHDPERATKAAVRYFEDIYKRLSDDPNYRVLKQRYGLRDDRLLHLAVINAFNSGEAHMRRAMELMAKEKSIRREVDEHAKYGGEGLFHYMAAKYAKEWKKWQKPVMKGPYYITHSPTYPYKVLAYKRLHEGGTAGKAATAGEKGLEGHKTRGAPASPKMQKVDGKDIRRYEDAAWSIRQHARKRFGDFPRGHDAFASNSYMFNQRMGDAAYELYKRASGRNEEFLILSRYYYSRARKLAEEQMAGRPGYILPKGGKGEVTKRLKYCSRALDIIQRESGK